MAGTVKKLQFSEGTDVGAPTDLGIATSTTTISEYADDTAFVTANGAASAGDVYINSTSKVLRYYTGSAWRNAVPQMDPTNATKTFLIDISGNTANMSATLTFTATGNRVYTFPDVSMTVASRAGSETFTNKTLTTPLITTNGSIDVTGAGTLAIGASMGANNMTLGGAASTVVIAGNLQVDGTTTTVNSTTLEVDDANIEINKGGNDASSEGAGISIDRTGTSGSFIYKDASASKFACGPAGTEVDVVTTTTTQGISNKTITVSDIDGGTASNTSLITLPKASTATLSGLIRKEATLVYDTDVDAPFYDNGTSLVQLATTGTLQDSQADAKNYSIACSVGSSALTISLKTKAGADPTGGDSVNIAFRNATSATGDYSVASTSTTTSVVVSSGSTLGHTSATPTTMYVYAINNAGSVELAVSSKLFDCLTVQSTTAEGGAGAADSATVMYSTTARTSKAVRLLARLVSSQTTAGTWAAVPTEISLSNTQVTPSGFTVVDSAAEYSANTKLELMPYFHGGSYLAGDAPTIGNYSSSGNGGTLSNIRSCFIPYQMQDGTWRMKFLINFSVSGQTSGTNNFSFTISGITTKNVASFNQQVSCSPIGNATSYSSYMAPNSNVVTLLSTANLNNAAVTAQGDIELDGKPNWAY